MATHSAIINYNEGFAKIGLVLESLNLPVSKYFHVGAKLKDSQRINKSNITATDIVKKQRKRRRAIKKGFLDNEKELEGGESYQRGNF